MIAAAIVAVCTAIASGGDALREGFANPPSSAKPHVWWHWMNGNVSKSGITADLEAMAKAGIGGAQIFDVSDGIPPGPIAFNSPQWFEMLRHANEEAKRLGIELCLANCSGWSSSGGPWVTPEDAEKDLVTAETIVKGGSAFDGQLACATNRFGFYRDLKVLAFPRPRVEKIVPIFSQCGCTSPTCTAKDNSTTFSFDRPFPLTGIALSFKTSGRHLKARVTVRAKRWDGSAVPEVATTVYPTRYGFEDDRIFIPMVAPDVRQVQVSCRPDKGAQLLAATPIATARIAEERAKTFFIRSRLVGMANPLVETEPGHYFIEPQRIVDLTSRMEGDGHLRWQAPADVDEWVVLRIGFAANGARCRPPTPAGDGLEVDKLSKSALGRYFSNGYIDRALNELGPVDPRGGVKALIVDSFEVKSQNWTEGLETVFAKRKGYDITRFLPVFAGRIVGSVKATDDFLADFREVVAALFVENYAAEFHRLCKDRGLSFYLEGYGSAPCADLRYARHCDVPMGEFWARDNLLTGNCRFAASIAHVWGHRIVASESFTTAETGRWTRDPFAYKAQGDRAYCAGINRIIYHRWAHQPWTNPSNYPGMTMGPHGSHFERTQTWWNDAAATWLKYQARCQWMLQQGVAASDLLVVADATAPSCGMDLSRWHEYESVAQDAFGRGIQWDLCDAEVLPFLRRENGRTVAPSGAAYREVIRLTDGKVPFIEPDVDCASGKHGHDLRWIHRRTATGDDIYFIALPNATKASIEVSFRQTGRRPEIWDPESGLVHAPGKWRFDGGRTRLMLDFKPSGAVFVVFRDQPTAGISPAEEEVAVEERQSVTGPWQVTFLDGRGAPKEPVEFPALTPWNESADLGIRYYSGSARYDKTIRFASGTAGQRVWLDLGDVKNVAVVTVNGKTYPVLWRPPYRVEITDALDRPMGDVAISVRVTNLWPNRLIGDDALPCDAEYRVTPGASPRELPGSIIAIPDRLWRGEPSPTGRHTFSTWRLWKKDERLLPSGLLGPVRFFLTPPYQTSEPSCLRVLRVNRPETPYIPSSSHLKRGVMSLFDGKVEIPH